MEREVLRAKSDTNSIDLAGAIAGVIGRGNICEVVSIGAGAGNQAIKACIIARKMVSSAGINLAIIPAFTTLTLPDREDPEKMVEVTAIKLITVLT